MTSKTTTKATSPRTSGRNSQQPRKKQSAKHSVKHSVKKINRINRQRRLQKQLQVLLLERHSRRCIICHHPEREAIEEEFVHWRAPWKLAKDYKLVDYRTVYRHARAAGLLLQRRERLHSALDAFVESVDDVTFTGDTILRAMRAYSCIDSHGRWTEIPTQVQFSTSHDGPPPQPPTRTSNVDCNVIDIDSADESEEDSENAPEERVTAYDVLNVIRKYSNQASHSDATARSASPKIKSPSDATACAAPPAQAVNVTSDDYDELDDDPESDEPDDDSDADEESEDDAENELEEALASVSTESDGEDDSGDDPDDNPDDNNDPKNKSDVKSLEEPTACAASPRPSRGSPAQSVVPLGSNRRGRNVTASVASASKTRSRSDATACAVSPAQALPRDVVRGQNPNDRSLSNRTDCAASPRPSTGIPAQPAVPPKPKPDADGLIWHPHPGYPNQEMSEPDAQGRVRYKIHMTTAASQLPSRETDAERAAELIYRSVIKKYGNP